MFCYCYWLLVLGVEVWLVLFGGFYMGVVGFVIVNVVYVDGIFICSFLVIICQDYFLLIIFVGDFNLGNCFYFFVVKFLVVYLVYCVLELVVVQVQICGIVFVYQQVGYIVYLILNVVIVSCLVWCKDLIVYLLFVQKKFVQFMGRNVSLGMGNFVFQLECFLQQVSGIIFFFYLYWFYLFGLLVVSMQQFYFLKGRSGLI